MAWWLVVELWEKNEMLDGRKVGKEGKSREKQMDGG